LRKLVKGERKFRKKGVMLEAWGLFSDPMN